MISCIVPAHNEEEYIESTLMSFKGAEPFCPEEVEIIVVENGERDGTKEIVERYGYKYYWTAHKSRTLAKNKGAIIAKGNILVFVDADCLVSENFFAEISEKGQNPFFIGGGVKSVRLPRLSLGIAIFLIVIACILLFYQVTVGAFWIRKEVFNLIGGFREYKLDDIDFARRLKDHAHGHGGKFESLKESTLMWSTRKFDRYGDWFWMKKWR